MPIHPLDVLVSVAGVALIVTLVWLATSTAPIAIADEAAARALLAREQPGFAIGRLVLDAQGRSAAAVSQDTRELALLFVLGQRIACWRLAVAQLPRASVRPNPDGVGVVLAIATGDFTRREVQVRLPDGSGLQGFLPGLGLSLELSPGKSLA